MEVVPTETFNLQAFVEPYVAHAKTDRLLFVADRCPKLRALALSLAVDEAKRTKNVNIYRKIFEKYPDAGQSDQAWLIETDSFLESELEKLESDVNTYRNSTNRENTRVCQ